VTGHAGGGPVPIAAIRRLHALGVRSTAAYQPATAVRHLNEALALLDTSPAPDNALRGRITLSLAHAEAELGHIATALSLFDRAERLLPDIESGVLFGQRGLLLLRTGRLADAVRQLDQALAVLPAGKEPVERAKVLLNRSTAYLFLGKLRLARADLVECEPLARSHQLSSIAIKVTQNLGYHDLAAGNIPGALAHLDDAARRCADELPSYLPVIILDKARALLTVGLADDADREAGHALTLLARQRLTEERAETELVRAQAALVANRPDAARRWARQAQRRFARRANTTWANLAALTEVRAAFAAGAAALPLARRSRVIAERLAEHGLAGDSRVALLFAARAYVAAGDTAAADDVVRGLRRLRPDDPVEVRLLWWLTNAELAHRGKRRRLRSRYVGTGLAWLHRHRSLLGSLDLQTAIAVHGRELAGLAVRTAIDDGRPAAVFSWTERARAQAFRLCPVTPPADPRTAQALEDLRHVDYALRDAELRREPTTRLRADRGKLEQRIREGAWFRGGYAASAPIATLAATRKALGDRALVAYLRDDGDLAALVLTAHRTELTNLGPYGLIAETHRRLRVDLDMLADERVVARTADAILTSARRQSARLAQQLIEPVLPVIGDRELVILPTGALHGVPWLQLPGARGRPVVVAPSATAWIAADQRRLDPNSSCAVLVAGPGIVQGERELASLATVYRDPTVLSGVDATVPATLHSMDGAGLVHIAAHGHHQPDNPLFSSLELSGGRLMGYDLQQVHRPPAHVILSACDVGRSTVRHGDEMLGLVAAMLYFGSATVVASLVRVADPAVPETMARYHRALARGMPPARAIAEATVHDIAAPFVCFGAG